MKKTFTFEIDTDGLAYVSDEYLAAHWYRAQFLSVEHGDRDAGEVVRAVGVEIIRRWMRSQPIPMFNIQSGDHLQQQIGRFARWNGTEWIAASAVDESRATVDDQPAGRNA